VPRRRSLGRDGRSTIAVLGDALRYVALIKEARERDHRANPSSDVAGEPRPANAPSIDRDAFLSSRSMLCIEVSCSRGSIEQASETATRTRPLMIVTAMGQGAVRFWRHAPWQHVQGQALANLLHPQDIAAVLAAVERMDAGDEQPEPAAICVRLLCFVGVTSGGKKVSRACRYVRMRMQMHALETQATVQRDSSARPRILSFLLMGELGHVQPSDRVHSLAELGCGRVTPRGTAGSSSIADLTLPPTDLSHLDINDAFSVADLSPRGDPEMVVEKGCCGQKFGAVCPILLEKASGIFEWDPNVTSSDIYSLSAATQSSGNLSAQENLFLRQVARLSRAALSSVTNAIFRLSQYHVEVMEDEDGMLIQQTMCRFQCELFGRKFQTSWRPAAKHGLHGNAVNRGVVGSGDLTVYDLATIVIDAPTCEWEDAASGVHSCAQTTKDAGRVLLAIANHSDFSWTESGTYPQCLPFCLDGRQDFVAQEAQERSRPPGADHLGACPLVITILEGGFSLRGHLPWVDYGMHFRRIGDVDKSLCVFECESAASFNAYPIGMAHAPSA